MEKTSEDHINLKLVGYWLSLYTQRVRWALRLKGVEYEYIEEDIKNKSQSLLELNPVYGMVPVLVHGGKPLAESLIILEYIDETWKHNPLLPEDPFERAQSRFWAKFVDEKVIQAVVHALFSEGEKQDNAVKLAVDGLGKLEEKLKLGNYVFFGGDDYKIGFLDLVMGFVSYLLPALEEAGSFKVLDPLKFPNIYKWIDNFINHDVIKSEYLPTKDEMVPHCKIRRQELIPVFKNRPLY